MAECSEVNHGAIGETKRVRLEVVSGVSLASNLVLVVNVVRNAPGAAQGAKSSHPPLSINEPQKVTQLIVGIPDDHSANVNP